ncbi:MAG: 30S ribosomal protein S7 [Parcubacteria group bacterium ADurb.Bin159]|nr:MAG: 30S ribosomal protein S7 [Parcubacteria group bacterium ADurb.Bin159]
MRGKRVTPRKIKPDLRYQDEKVAKFINYLMCQGKKNAARRIFYDTLDYIGKNSGEDALKIFFKAIDNVGPKVELRSRRIGGGNYQIPFPTDERRRFTLASRWIIEAARDRKGKPMREKLAEEILAASKEQGSAITKRDNVYKMAEANRAFAHLARRAS